MNQHATDFSKPNCLIKPEQELKETKLIILYRFCVCLGASLGSLELILDL